MSSYYDTDREPPDPTVCPGCEVLNAGHCHGDCREDPHAEVCLLCGQGVGPQGYFGGGVTEGSLHHDFDRQVIARQADGSTIAATCYEAWTTWGRRP